MTEQPTRSLVGDSVIGDPLTGNTDACSEAQRGGRIAPEARRGFIIAMSISVMAASFGDIAIKKGISGLTFLALNSFAALGHSILVSIASPWLDLGIVLMVVHFTAFVRALHLGPLSLVVPLRASAYISTTLLAQYFLHERVSPTRWVAILIILAGVVMMGQTGSRDR